MKLSKWVPLAVTGTVGLLIAVNAWWTVSSIQKIHAGGRESAQDLVPTQFRAELEASGQRAAAIATAIARLPPIEQAMKDGDREGMQRILEPVFKELKTRFGVEVLQFTSADAKVLLRMHQPAKFGDSATGRDLVTTTLERKISQSGIEIGSSGVKVRGMIPVGSQEHILGVAEIGMPFESVVETVKHVTGFELGVYIHKKVAGKAEGRVVGDLIESAVSNGEVLRTVVPDSSIDIVQQVSATKSNVAGVEYAVVRMPLLDVGNQNIGTVVAVRSFEASQARERADVLQAIVQATLLTIFCAGIITIVFYGLVIRPLQTLTITLRDDEAIAELTARQDEVGEVARRSIDGGHAA